MATIEGGVGSLSGVDEPPYDLCASCDIRNAASGQAACAASMVFFALRDGGGLASEDIPEVESSGNWLVLEMQAMKVARPCLDAHRSRTCSSPIINVTGVTHESDPNY
ncbi:MAG TPA: hypothetical protein VFN56_02945 [Candidatus Saccharimonadales bacterium]|nr:hypothetical protein [Candidatus Saccharimonadales bacterium]